MTSEELRRRILDPEPGSSLARARAYGIDLTLLYRNLMLTPDERLAKAERNHRLARDLREVREQNRK